MKLFLTILILLLPTAILFAQVDVSVSVDPSAVRIGDRAKLTIAVDFPDTVKIGFVAPSDSMIGSFNVLDVMIDSLEKSGNMSHLEIHYQLVYFNIGDGLVPPLGVIVVHSDGSQDTLLTQPMRIFFKSLLGDTPPESLDIRDVKSPRMVPFNWNQLAKNALIALAIVAILFALLGYSNLRKRGISLLEFIAPKKSPWELALSQLDNLAKSDLLEIENYKDYFDRLTDILREYIEGRLGIQALELSTTETMENLREASVRHTSRPSEQSFSDISLLLSAWFIESTEILLKRADMVKFAKLLPEIAIALEDWQSVKKLIIDTIPEPVEDESKEQIQNIPPETGNNIEVNAR